MVHYQYRTFIVTSFKKKLLCSGFSNSIASSFTVVTATVSSGEDWYHFYKAQNYNLRSQPNIYRIKIHTVLKRMHTRTLAKNTQIKHRTACTDTTLLLLQSTGLERKLTNAIKRCHAFTLHNSSHRIKAQLPICMQAIYGQG